MEGAKLKYQFITIEGNIGAGKTSLSRKLADDFNGQLILEQFADNPFLPKFYEEPEKHAFPLELFFMAERYQQLKQFLSEPSLFNDTIISDYIFYKSLIFASVNLSLDEQKLYNRLFHIINPTLPQPDVILYLHSPVETLLQNIRKRGRTYEQGIQTSYLASIQKMYMDFFKIQTKTRVLILDASELNFVDNDEDYRKIIQILCTDYPKGLHHLSA